MKSYMLLLGALFAVFSLFSQDISNCNLNGSNDRWESQWRMPGVTETIFAMIEGPDGNVWLTGSYGSTYGGDNAIDGVVTWDGERYAQIGGSFRCTSCGLGTRYALANGRHGNVYVGGIFEGVENTDESYVEASGLIRWNHQAQIWEAIGDVLKSNGSKGIVRSIAVDTVNNMLYIGGDFAQIVYPAGASTAVQNIAAFDLNTQTWSSMDGGVQNDVSYLDGIVYALEMGAGNTLYVGGGFNEVDNTTVYGLAQWSPTTGWATVGGGLPNINIGNNDLSFGSVRSLAYEPISGRLYAGGDFGELSGSGSDILNRSFAYYENNTWTLIPGIGKPFNASSYRVNAIGIDSQSGLVYAGGSFFEHTGNNSPIGNLVAAWNPSTQQWNDLDDGLNPGSVRSILIKEGAAFAAGNFSKYNGIFNTNNFIKWTGTEWDNLGTGLTETFGTIYDLELMTDGFIAAGNFTEVDELDAEHLARWRELTGWETLDLGLFGNSSSNFASLPYALHREGDWLYFGGQFGGVDGNNTSNGIAAYNLTTGVFKTWGSGLDGFTPRVNDIVSFQGAIHIAGRFTGIDGQTIEHLARLDPNTDTWESIGLPGNEVRKLTNVKDSILIVMGGFTNIDGNTALKRVGVYDGTNWSAIGQGINNGNVQDAVYLEREDAILLGGSFSQANQSDGSIISARRLAKYKNNTWVEYNGLVPNSGFNEATRLHYDAATGLVYVAGRLIEADGRDINRVFRIDPLTGAVGDLGSGLDRLVDNLSTTSGVGQVNYIGIQNGKLTLAGQFNSAGLNQASSIARYDLELFAEELAELDIALPDSLESCETITLNSFANSSNISWSTGASTNSITVSEGGVYSVTVTSAGGCSNSDSTYVTIFPAPTINFEGITGDTVVACNEIVLEPEGNFVEYNWNNGTSSESTLVVNQSGWVYFDGQDSNNCFGTDSVFVMIETPPFAELLSEVVEDTLFLSVIDPEENAVYVWDFGDGTTETGASVTHIYASGGTYTIALAATNECGTANQSFTIIIDVVDSQRELYSPLYFLASPNPTNGWIDISWQHEHQDAVLLELFDINGRLQWQGLPGTGQSQSVRIDLSDWAAGVYFGRLSSEQGVYSFRVIRQ